MILAITTAMAQLAPEGIMKVDKIIEDIKKTKADGLTVPAICAHYIANKALKRGSPKGVASPLV